MQLGITTSVIRCRAMVPTAPSARLWYTEGRSGLLRDGFEGATEGPGLNQIDIAVLWCDDDVVALRVGAPTDGSEGSLTSTRIQTSSTGWLTPSRGSQNRSTTDVTSSWGPSTTSMPAAQHVTTHIPPSARDRHFRVRSALTPLAACQRSCRWSQPSVTTATHRPPRRSPRSSGRPASR